MTNIIRIIDVETSDMEPPSAKVIEIGWCDLTQADDQWVVGEPHSYLCGGVEKLAPAARATHHIAPHELIGHAPFSPAKLQEDAAIDRVVLFAAHNAEYELKFFQPLLPVLCTYKAALRTWLVAPSHSNGALRYWLEDEGILKGVDPALAQPAHRAGPDAYVTAHLLKALLGYKTAREMLGWSKEPRLLPTCPIGKFRGKPWGEVEGGFLAWMLKQQDMEADLRWNAQQELDRRAAFAR